MRREFKRKDEETRRSISASALFATLAEIADRNRLIGRLPARESSTRITHTPHTRGKGQKRERESAGERARGPGGTEGRTRDSCAASKRATPALGENGRERERRRGKVYGLLRDKIDEREVCA